MERKKRKSNYIGHEIVGASRIEKIAQRLKLPKRDQKRMKYLIKHHMDLHQAPKPYHFRKIRFNAHSYEKKHSLPGNLLDDLILLWQGDNYGKNLKISQVSGEIYEELKPHPIPSRQIVRMLKEAGIPMRYNGLAVHKSWYIWMKDYNQTEKSILHGVKSYIEAVMKREGVLKE